MCTQHHVQCECITTEQLRHDKNISSDVEGIKESSKTKLKKMEGSIFPRFAWQVSPFRMKENTGGQQIALQVGVFPPHE